MNPSKKKTKVELEYNIESYERALIQIERFKNLHPIEHGHYNLSLVPYFYENSKSIVPITFQKKLHMVRWEHFVRWRQLGAGQVNKHVQYVYLIEFIAKDGSSVYKVGVAKHIKKRFEGLNSYYKIGRTKEFGPFPSLVATKIEKEVRNLFTLKEAHVTLGVSGEKECVEEDVFGRILDIEKTIKKYFKYKEVQLDDIL